MDTVVSSLSLAKVLLPKMPTIGKTLVSHTLGLSPNSTHWDLKTELTVNILRSFTYGGLGPISRTQAATLNDPGIKGRIWVAKVTLPVPSEDDVRQKLFQVIEEMKDSGDSQHPGGFIEPKLLPVEGEWTGYRAFCPKGAPRLRISETQQYAEMMKEVTSPVTILYMHGGAHWLLDPASYRQQLKKLAKSTGGRVLSLRYRLAPQNPFPAALLDCLVAYLDLLFPPAGSLHAAVSPENIIISGDSAGGNLSLSLLLVILHLNRTSQPITWNGESHLIPLPAGLALNSPWTDLLCSCPSLETNKAYDYIPPPSIYPAPHSITYPSCPLWPTPSPRSNIYCEDTFLIHPLVSPLSAGASAWKGSPPILFQIGTEQLADESKILAARMANVGVQVGWEEYEYMPHCFALVLPHLRGTTRCFESWARFCGDVGGLQCVEKGEKKREIMTNGVKISPDGVKETEVDVKGLWKESDEVVLERMRNRARILVSFGKKMDGDGNEDVSGEGNQRARL